MSGTCCPRCGHTLTRVAPTPKQRQLLNAIKALIDETGTTPSYEQMALRIGKTKGSVQRLLRGLAERGYVRLPKHCSRRLELFKERAP